VEFETVRGKRTYAKDGKLSKFPYLPSMKYQTFGGVFTSPWVSAITAVRGPGGVRMIIEVFEGLER